MTLPIEITERRLTALKKIADEYGIEWNPENGADSTMDEDVQLYFLDRDDEERKVPQQWAAVTKSGTHACIYADYENPTSAQERAVEYVDDDTFAESPVAVIDLDTGHKQEPDWTTLRWKRVQR